MLADHIRTLLQDHDCVIIPDFGGLIADYAPARIHPVRHTLSPPAKRVAFNQSLTRNDGLLVDALSAKLNLSTAQARQLVRDAVLGMEQELEAGRRTELSGIGTFRQAPGRGLEFEYTGTQNLLGASFGLPELVSRPVRATDALLARERPAAVPQLGGSSRRRAWLRTLGVAAVISLAASAEYLYLNMLDRVPESLQISALKKESLNAAEQPVLRRQQAGITSPATPLEAAPVAEAPAPASDWDAVPAAPAVTVVVPAAKPAPVIVEPAKKITVPASAIKPAVTVAAAPVQAAKAAAKPVAKPAGATPAKAKAPGWEKAAATNATPVADNATIKSRTGRYFVVAGSYTSLANAEKGRQALVRLGHPARVILPAPGSRQFMLSVADYADRASADRQASILRKRMGDLWIKQY
ncbi:SPOR domain-containing protein [Hymenobacter sp. NST-14]|uniref:HU domain-containing protein n=1 Tax=Hymenobacter piscis TaxID=2839984 RepID=UPI001C026F2F|nr:SPOR domain-containing protein [Hymenobacter piscis]MBT9392342.1 SPOR domain-containing protein [Hymenobacter piscis]